MKKNYLLRLLVIFTFLFLFSLTLYSESNAALTGKEPWADSLLSMTTSGESSLQYLLDSLGYNIDVANDELGWEVFCGIDGMNTATMVMEVAGSAVLATSGYYEAGVNSPLYQIFGPSNVPGDSIQFTFTSFDSIGFWMKPNLDKCTDTWYTENSLNYDGFDHVWIFSTGEPHEYLICFEDLPDGGDEDYQDLVFKVRFHNFPPVFDVPDTTVIQCGISPVCFDIVASDPNCQGDSIWLSMTSGEGTFAPDSGLEVINATHCFTPMVSGDYEFEFLLEDITGETSTATAVVHVIMSYPPVVEINDTTVDLCEPSQVCLPVSISDDDCDITSVTSNIGDYSGSYSNFDQVDFINQYGGSVIQIGGGDPGKNLYIGSDYVNPVNSQSGVSVSLPSFGWVNHVVNYGTFPSGTVANSGDQLLGAPTDMTYSAGGPSGPDGTDGDGSVPFSTHNWIILGFADDITSCNGSNSDLVIFTGTSGFGTAQLFFRYNGSAVYDTLVDITGGSTGSGIGGVILDLPDGLTYNQLKIRSKNGSFDLDAIAGRTAPSPTSTDICFDADTSGIYEVIVTATDACGNSGVDTAYVTVNLNSAPIANAGEDISTFICEYEEFCFNVSFSDIDNNIVLTEKVSGPGTLTNNEICFTPTTEGSNTFVIRAVDDCGLEDYDTVIVTFEANNPPVADDPDSIFIFLCETAEQCYTFTATDPDGGPLTWTHLTGVGSITSEGLFCFTPTVSGNYGAAVVVTDSCGASDTTTIQYVVTLNEGPVADDPGPAVDVFQCTAEEICYQFSAIDPDGSVTWSKLSGEGSVTSDGLWCFAPVVTGSYSVTAEVTDSCGLADTVTHTYNITINDPPSIAFGEDTTLLLCEPTEICLYYIIDDPQGFNGLVETMVSGYGSIDTANDRICFTPTTDGVYEFIVSVDDSCGIIKEPPGSTASEDTILVTVSFGEVASIDCPASPINVSLCQADQVCQMLDITPATATVSTSFGTYSGGQLCFNADTSGTYAITVIAEEECGADTCEVIFNVDIGTAATISCPAPITEFLCEADSICVPVGINGSGLTVTVSPIGTYNAGNVCFPADTSGHYEIEVIATASCGSDTCLIVADVVINSAPIATDPSSPIDTFICNSNQICYQFSANDADGGTLTWSRLSGNGTVNSTGLWCFDANNSGSYTVVTEVSDSCGAKDTLSLTYNVTINSAPTLALGDDTTLFTCALGIVCWPYTAYDANDNITSIDIISGGASSYIDDVNDRLCFIPSAEGLYEFVVSITDGCGEINYDTIQFTIEENEAPLVDAGEDQTIFQCELSEICWDATVVDPDGNLTSYELVDGPGTYNGSQICFTPTETWNYEFVLKGTDFCGLESYDTVAIYYTLNSSPTADAGADQSFFLCEPTEICWTASCDDVDGNLSTCTLIEGPGNYDGSQICFTANTSGSYLFVLEAVDDCGKTDVDSVTIDITMNTAPVCTVPNDTSIFQCNASEVCLPLYGTDIDGNLEYCQIISGPGSLVGGNWCYTPVSDQAVTVTVRCQDSCGAYCESDFTVLFDINTPPSITFGNDTSIFLCDINEICLPYIASDPDAPHPTTITLLSGNGTLNEDSSWVCFTPTTSDLYTFVIKIEDECGEYAEDTINVNITINTPPTADAGADQTLFLCDSVTQICWTAFCDDIDGNLANCYFNGPGSYNNGEICFTPPATGSYLFTLRAVDDCGEEMIDSVYINAVINSEPTIAFGEDFSQMLCTPEEICLDYIVNDNDGPNGIIETMVSGYGTLDTAANQICFTPTTDGVYEFIIRADDSCTAGKEPPGGGNSLDTIVVTITFGDYAVIDCPTSPIDEFLCGPAEVCLPISIDPVDATVSTSFGTYSNGNLCFNADTAGTYSITIIAEAECGADTCTVDFNITLNNPPVADAGSDQTIFQCTPTEICWPVSCSDPDDNLNMCELVSGPGTYGNSQICFTPGSTSDSYQFILKATDECGLIDYDTVNIDVTINSSPTVTAQNDSTLFLCAPQTVCLTYTPGDPDGLSGIIESMISGYGSIDTLNNEICFTPTSSGTYEFIIGVIDPCGQTDEDTVVVTVTFGESANIDCPVDPYEVFLCQAGSICQTIDITPSGATVSTSFGTYSAGELCFQADTSGTYNITIIADMTCGSDTCNLTFNVEIGLPTQIDCPAPVTKFICEAGTVNIPVGIYGSDINVSVSPIGTYSSGTLSFPADTSGSYEITIIASGDCGSDTCVVNADITINSAPTANDPGLAVDTFMCETGQVCYQFNGSDADGGDLVWSRISGDGTVSPTGLWCFDVTGDGTMTVTAQVSDSCGASDTVTHTYNIDLNDAPIITLDDDISEFVCNGNSYCFNYTVTNTDDPVSLEELISGSGTLDTTNNEICFSPTSSGVYEFIMQVTDSCGLSDVDTINVTIELGNSLSISCPNDTTLFLCGPEQICLPITIPVDTNVTVSPIGTYNNGEICFNADTAGHYVITVTANSSCGSDNCTFIVDVTMNSDPVAVDPPVDPIDTFMCVGDEICYQFSATDVDGTSLTWSRVSGPGTISADGLWCFNANATGTYTVVALVTDPCGATDQVTLTYNVTLNSAPVVAFGTDETFFQCNPSEICVNFSVADNDNNISLIELINGYGNIIDDSLVCFTPDTAGTYTFIIGATDNCGAYDRDTVNIFIELNTDPIAFAGEDQALFLCEAMEICWEAYSIDPDNNIDTCYLTIGPGIFDGSQICFTPDTPGVYTFVLKAEDECTGGRAVDEDTVFITIDFNDDPICNIPNDTTFFQCEPAQIALPIGATDPDGNFDHCEIVTGPGSISNGFWTYTPSADITTSVKIMCLDSCGAMCEDSFTVSFDINTPPVVDLGPDTGLFLCSAQLVCWDIVAEDEDGNLATVEVIEPAGAYINGSQLCYSFTNETVQKFVVKATDSCGAITYDSTTISVDFNVPPELELPPDFTAYLDVMGEVCFDVSSSDIDDNLSTITVSPIGTYNPGTDQICFNVDTSGIYCLEITARDLCGAQTVDTICLEMVIDECIHVQIEKTHGTIQGQYETVSIYQQGSGKDVGGFDLLIAYDASALTPNLAVPGGLFEACGWEYFTYRNGDEGNCNNACPSGLLRIVGMAELNNGAYHPGCFLADQIGSLTDIEFLVTNDRTFECMYVPIRFFWLDCGDNTFSSRLGDTLWISRNVYDFELSEITDYSYGFPGYYGAHDDCLIGGGPDKPAAIRCVDFTNGGIDIICADSIDDRGDLNLNGVGYEIADAVVYTNYFVYGLSALNISLEAQTAASDVNADGITLSVADLVYLIRVVVGDAMAIPKLDPNLSSEVIFNLNNGILSIKEADYKLGAIFLTIEGNVTPTLHADASQMELRSNFDGTITRVLVYNMNGKDYLETGNVLNIGPNHKIKEIEVGAYNGLTLKATLGSLPDKFELLQNYPNPFNPVTNIKFALPVATKWDLTIYNILGQQVDNFNGDSEAGYQVIEWDASRYASGVYFYRLKAGSFSATKKMVMVK